MLVLKFILQYIADIVTQGIMAIFLSYYCTRNAVTKSVYYLHGQSEVDTCRGRSRILHE